MTHSCSKLSPIKAEALAEAFEKAGFTNDEPEPIPNPYVAAREAFFVCQSSRRMEEWRDLKAWFKGRAVPRVAYYRKLAEICHRALRRPHMPEDLRESVAYARGHFDALVKVGGGRNTAGDDTLVN